MSKQENEVVTQTDAGTLIQLDGTETDLQGNPISKGEAKVKEQEADAAAEAVNKEAEKANAANRSAARHR